VTYDVSRLLKNGDNVIAVWTASGWASNKGFGKFNKLSCFRARLSTVNTAGSDAPKALVNSDTSWKCYVSSSEGTELMTQWNKNGGERLDARADVPDWNTVGFDDSQWDTPKTLTIEPPITSVANVQPTKIIETYKPVAIHEIKEGYRVEFAKNFTGWVNADFRGLQSGDTVTIMTSDDKTIVCNFNQRSFYIAAGKEKETFRYRFNYAAGRFVTFAGLKQKPALDDFTGYALGTDLKRTSSFACSNELYNKIYELDLWTFRVNTPEGFTMDCPHRERMGYGEVATATSWGIGIPNYDTAAFYRKIVQDLVDVQDPNGYVPHVAPVPEHQHWGGPMWCSAGLSVALEHYVNFGDERVIQLIYPSAKLWLGFLNTNTKDGLLVPYLGPPKFLGDWLAPGSRSEFGDKPQAAYFNNCVYAWNLEEMIRICKILGKTSDAELYEKRLADLKTNIIKKFCKPETGIFMDGGQVQQAFALFAELTDDAELARRVRERLGQAFKEKPYFDMGSSGLPVLLHYITEHPEELGQTAAAILNKTDYPGYGYFIKRGETAHPEDWKVDVPSRMHTCYTGIASWFIKSLGGIRPDPEKPGYQSFIVQPVFAEGTDWAETSVESPYGKIVSRWERKGQTIELSVSVPPNSTAKIVIPSKNGNKPVVVESGKHQFSVENVHGK
jgi:alpha-L-rhamnosidase